MLGRKRLQEGSTLSLLVTGAALLNFWRKTISSIQLKEKGGGEESLGLRGRTTRKGGEGRWSRSYQQAKSPEPCQESQVMVWQAWRMLQWWYKSPQISSKRQTSSSQSPQRTACRAPQKPERLSQSPSAWLLTRLWRYATWVPQSAWWLHGGGGHGAPGGVWHELPPGRPSQMVLSSLALRPNSSYFQKLWSLCRLTPRTQDTPSQDFSQAGGQSEPTRSEGIPGARPAGDVQRRRSEAGLFSKSSP